MEWSSRCGYGRHDPEGPVAATVVSLPVETLIANGFTDLYCLPGMQNDPFFDSQCGRRDALAPA